METRANYVLIGAFAVLGFLGMLGFILAFGKIQFDRQFATYEVRFDSVSGLSRAADVRFAGLPVGQVTEIALDPAGDGRVIVTLEVDRETPVRADSQAVVESSGITGVSFVAIGPGSLDAPLINDRTDTPELEAGRSTIQSLTEGAPRILDETLQVLEQVNRLLGDENQSRVVNILDNVERSSGEITRALDNFAAFTDTIAEATDTFAEFSGNLAPILLQAEQAVEALQFAIDEFALLATESRITFETGTEALQTVDRFVTGDLTEMAEALRVSADEVQAEITAVSREAQETLATFTRTGDAVTERLIALDPALARIEPLLDRADTTLETVERMSARIDTLVAGDGTALVAEAREMVALAREATENIAAVAETDLPAIMADVRAATAEVRTVVDTVGSDLAQVSGQVAERVDTLSAGGLRTLDQVTETFANANTTLDAINRALATSEGAIEAAERAFIGADRVMNEEVAVITADLRDVLGRLGAAVDAVSEDIPLVTADLRRTAESAATAFDDVGRLVRDSSGPLREFTTGGLPNITQLARETRGLITNLDRLTRQIERDPARFLLNRQTPEFRR